MEPQWWHVIVFLTANVGFVIATGVDSAKGSACDWVICNRHRTDETFSCNNSYIFVENVTDFWGAPSDQAYKNLRYMCMGTMFCSPRRICNSLRLELHRVRYVCVNVSELWDNKKCEWPVGTIWGRKGHIHSPNYPASYPYQGCSWRISAPEDRFVHISVHDVSFNFAPDPCNAGLNITYQECASGHVISRLYCDNFQMDSELIACGTVSVQLVTEKRFSGVRFWLSFEVTSSPEAAVRPPLLEFVGQCNQGVAAYSRILSSHVLQRPVLRPLDPTVVMVSSTFNPQVLETTSVSGAVTSMQTPSDDKGGLNISITVIIVIVSTIGAILFIVMVLAVIFLKRPTVQRVEHVYAVPTPRDASPESPPNSASPLKHERPFLKECYCAVADEIPTPGLHVTPASPGYAEVADVCKGDNCRWDPHKFTFGPTLLIRPTPPSDLPFSKTSPNISSFAVTSPQGKQVAGAPSHNRTFSDSSHLFSNSPFLDRSSRTTRSFRDPKTTDYENIVIDDKNKSPCLVQNGQKYLLQSRLGRVTAAAKSPSEGVKCVQVSPPVVPTTEALYATSSVMNDSGAKKYANMPGHSVYSNIPGGIATDGHGCTRTGHNSENKSGVNIPHLYTKINNSVKRPEVNGADNHGTGTKIPGSKSHRKQHSKGDNAVTGELQHYENLSIVQS